MDRLLHELYRSDFSLTGYDRYYFGLRYLGNRFLLSKLQKYLSDGRRVLDIGSGRLLISATLAADGSAVTALDLPEVFQDRTVRKRAQTYGIDLVGYRLRPGENHHLPFKDNHFSIILMSEVFEHLNFSPAGLLKEVRRVLANGGLLILTTPNVHRIENKINFFLGRSIYADYQRYLVEAPYHYHWREFDSAELTGILQQFGFQLKETHFFNDVLVNRYSRYLFRSTSQKAKAYLKKMLYYPTRIWPGLRKQIIIVAASQAGIE